MTSTEKQEERDVPAKQSKSDQETKNELIDKNTISSSVGMGMKVTETGSSKNREERGAVSSTTDTILGLQTKKPESKKSPSITDNLSPKISVVTAVPIRTTTFITSEKSIVTGSESGIKILSTAPILPTTATVCSQTAAASKTKADTTKVTVTVPKQFHLKTHPQKQQQPQKQHRYNRQNQEEAVFKMVQNIFKLLETRECTIIR